MGIPTRMEMQQMMMGHMEIIVPRITSLVIISIFGMILMPAMAYVHTKAYDLGYSYGKHDAIYGMYDIAAACPAGNVFAILGNSTQAVDHCWTRYTDAFDHFCPIHDPRNAK
ncbi:MAG: hypothetical protein WAM14_13080 [Candidatus Nitrosopolaris sp.]